MQLYQRLHSMLHQRRGMPAATEGADAATTDLPSTCIDALPDEVLRDVVFPLLPFRTRAGAVRAVCRHWRDITDGSSACWRAITIDGDYDLPCTVLEQIRFLASRTTAIRFCHLSSWSGPAADAMFMALAGLLAAPARVEVVSADEDCDLSANVLNALPLLPNLRHLEARAMYGAVPARQFGQLLGDLQHLSHIDLRFRPCACEKIEGGFPRSLLTTAAAANLTHLCLDNAGPGAFPKLPARIDVLAKLRHLSLADCGVASLPASLVRLTALSCLDISQSPASEDEAIEVALPKGLLWRMPALRRLAMPAPGWLPQLARTTQLTFLRLTNVAAHKTGRRYVRTFATLAAAGRLDVSSNLDLAQEDGEEVDGEVDDVIRWATAAEEVAQVCWEQPD